MVESGLSPFVLMLRSLDPSLILVGPVNWLGYCLSLGFE